MARMGKFTDASGTAWKFWKGRWRRTTRSLTRLEREEAYRKRLADEARIQAFKTWFEAHAKKPPPAEEVGRG